MRTIQREALNMKDESEQTGLYQCDTPTTGQNRLDPGDQPEARIRSLGQILRHTALGTVKCLGY